MTINKLVKGFARLARRQDLVQEVAQKKERRGKIFAHEVANLRYFVSTQLAPCGQAETVNVVGR